MNDIKEVVEEVFRETHRLRSVHSHASPVHPILSRLIKIYFSTCPRGELAVQPFQGLNWPYIDMGNISSYDMFSFDEYMLFSFYSRNTKTYRKIFDIGANLGLHSVFMSRLGYQVDSFEPDPHHFELMTQNVKRNNCQNIRLHQAGVSDQSGQLEFVRVKGNTTASHIAGSRGFHGDVDRFQVKTVTFQELGELPDFMKIDVEGHEKNIITSLPLEKWKKIDAIVEVHTEDNRDAIFNYFKGTGIEVFSQKINWEPARRPQDMPQSNKEGNIFISAKKAMPWGEQ